MLIKTISDLGDNAGTAPRLQQTPTGPEKAATVLCVLDFVLGNLKIHYSRTKVLHPRQGLSDVMEVMREEGLLAESVRLIYFLAGRADLHLSASAFGRSLEKLLDDISSLNPRVMLVMGGLVMSPNDTDDCKSNLVEINSKIAKIAEKDPHWAYFNPNFVLSLGGQVQKRFFDRDGKLNNQGCIVVAKGLVSVSKLGRMHQNFGVLPPRII